jgi:hypothetical protein
VNDETISPSDPDAIPEPSMQYPKEVDLLERGWPGEIMPGKMRDRLTAAAERYVKDDQHEPDARQRVRDVWISQKYRPSYQRYTPRPGRTPDFG